MQLEALFKQPQALPAIPKIVHELIENDEKVVVFTQFRGVLAAIQRRFHPFHVAVTAFVHEMDQPLARRPGVGRRGEAADVEAQLLRPAPDLVSGVPGHGAR